MKKSAFGKFESRRKMFSVLIEAGVSILQKEEEGYFVYCNTATVPEETKEGLAIILADMTFNCPIRILIGGT